MLSALAEYARLLADLPERYSYIRSSTLTIFTIGPFVAEIEGQLAFDSGYVLTVWELLDLASGTIRSYSYELDRAEERIWWYDPTEHPHAPVLRSSYPHHKHIPPDIKRHRVPAPEISFIQPNLPVLIEQIILLLSA